MSHRVFTDSAGVSWEVWDVVPGRLLLEARNHRAGSDRRVATQGPRPDEGERRRGGDRRAALSPQLRHGWLAFRNGNERRRLAPIPENWEEATHDQLQRWCAAAESVVEVRRQQRR